ncbi:MAG TPA: hypothetical protein VGD98_13440 [Ktedonobacteraceae bacterium]
MTQKQPEPVFACNPYAIPQAYRAVHQVNTRQIFTSAQEMQELPTGYAWRLPNETDILQTVVAFLSYERLCCPFLRFRLEIEPEQGPVWLQITGVTDVKEFLQSQGVVPPATTTLAPVESA